MGIFLDFVNTTLGELRCHQSQRLGASARGVRCYTKTSSVSRAYRSIGARRGDSFITFDFPDCFPDPSPKGMDFSIWPVLDRLAKSFGNEQAGEELSEMIDVFVDYGFDVRSGLPYWGLECEFDILNIGPAPNRGEPIARFKFEQDMPYDLVWKAAPEKMARALKASYWGLITRPETMNFNRFCWYGFDDRVDGPSQDFSPGACGFAGAAAHMIHAWCLHASRTGSEKSLGWARGMAEHWMALQHPDTGLLPHLCAAKKEDDDDQAVQPYANPQDAHIPVEFAAAARFLREGGIGLDLADELTDFAKRLAHAYATFGYDEERQLFHNWISVATGEAFTEAYYYHFNSQAQKDTWVAIDPKLAIVKVCPGPRIYGHRETRLDCFDPVIVNLATVADETGDQVLLERLASFIPVITQRFSEFNGPLNESGHWTCFASAGYIQAMLVLARHTGEAEYITSADKIATREMASLEAFSPAPDDPASFEWWRMPLRNRFLMALLDLEDALTT